ncbi:serine hydrolase [Candidatus Eisenbacteria bacterium]|uniref:Serine hydrolase n=1 Tax=Eiseniibacteriota bacterium TaxID=2212470 RepID=A0ABV6YP79_UNCEI
MITQRRLLPAAAAFLLAMVAAQSIHAQASPLQHPPVFIAGDSDQDGLPDSLDACPAVAYAPGFNWAECAPMDENPDNDPEPQCKARERVVQTLLSSGVFATHIAFSIVIDGTIHFADAFSYIGAGQYEHDPDGVHRLYRVGSTSKSIVATAASVLDGQGELSLDDFVNDDDATQVVSGGQRTLRQLLSHQGAFKLDSGALHLFCYPGDLPGFWAEADDLVSPHYDSAVYGNLDGGYQYSAFNYSLAGAYMETQTGEPFAQILQTRVFDPAGMCTASLDGPRAAGTTIGDQAGVSQSASMHLGPYINQVSLTDSLCEDNFYSSEDLPGDTYNWQYYHLDEASARPRDPPGGVIASVIDMAHFASALLYSYHNPDGLLTQSDVRDLWEATTDIGCFPGCPYERYYGIGFFTDSQQGEQVTQVGHGGSRAGYKSSFVLRPEENTAVCVLVNADVSTVALSDLAKTILDDVGSVAGVDSDEPVSDGPVSDLRPSVVSIEPNPLATNEMAAIRFSVPREAKIRIQVFSVRGQLVGSLGNRMFSAGQHSVWWVPADNALSPGTYFVRFSSQGVTDLKKVVVYR